jgi:hypothetical protein
LLSWELGIRKEVESGLEVFKIKIFVQAF